MILVVSAGVPVKTLAEFLAWAKQQPDGVNYATPGAANPHHHHTKKNNKHKTTNLVHVPYRGAAPALTDLLGGQIDFLFDPGISLQHVKSGKVRMLAVASPQRAPLVPEVPTLDELGLKGFDADAVFGFYAPANTPAALVKRLNTEINRVLNQPAVKDRIVAIGNVPQESTPEAFKQKGADDFRRLGALIRERGIKGD